MTIFGKVLAVLNIFAALFIGYLAAADWGARNSWAYNYFRMELALDGLPVDESQTDADGTRIVDKLTDISLKDMFQPVGGFPVQAAKAEDKTQTAALQRFQTDLWGKLASLDENAQREKLRDLLLPVARGLGDRAALEKKIKEAPKAAFDEVFADALKADKGREAERRAIAHLLFNLNPEEKDRKWAATVIGLKSLAAEAGRQAQVYREMATQMRLLLANDWDRYEKEQFRIVGELRTLAAAVDEKDRELTKRKELVQKHNVLLQARISDVAELKANIEKARSEARETLEKLAKEQRLLFDAQKRVGNGVDQNLKLESDIRNLEEAAPSGR